MKMMIKIFTLSILLIGTVSNAQCILLSDTATAGDYVGDHEEFYYDSNDSYKLLKTEYYTSGIVYRYDTVHYDTQGRMSQVDSYYDMGFTTPSETIVFTYNSSNQIIAAAESGDNGSGPWSRTYSISYDGQGRITDIDLLTSSGPVDGLSASMNNLVYDSSNHATTVEMTADFMAGIETVILNIQYDDKENLEAHYPVTDALDLLFTTIPNNYVLISLGDSCSFGNPGDVGLERIFTYNVNNEVATMQTIPAIFNGDSTYYEYQYDCSYVSVEEMEETVSFDVYPNPASDQVVLELGIDDFNGTVLLISTEGKVVRYFELEQNTEYLDLSDVNPGIYFITIQHEGGLLQKKLIIQ